MRGPKFSKLSETLTPERIAAVGPDAPTVWAMEVSTVGVRPKSSTWRVNPALQGDRHHKAPGSASM